MLKNEKEEKKEIKSHLALLERDEYEIIFEKPKDYLKILENLTLLESEIEIRTYLKSLTEI